MPIQVLLADNTEMMRKVIRNLLAEEPGIRLVGEASTFAQTVQLARELKPHIIVLDVHMPDDEDVAPANVKSHFRAAGARVLAISVWDDDDTKSRAKSLGAIRLLEKGRLYTELIPAIKQLHQGPPGE
ncbi:MAG TPA: response regulator transcription factor [Candidatus Acidoferrales bacterium]|nr:response regulator transcription factor [Candidatus Acidoferrales bacterium]